MDWIISSNRHKFDVEGVFEITTRVQRKQRAEYSGKRYSLYLRIIADFSHYV